MRRQLNRFELPYFIKMFKSIDKRLNAIFLEKRLIMASLYNSYRDSATFLFN